MHRFSRSLVIAVAAAAIAPAAHAASPFPGWTTITDDQGLEWLAPDGTAPVAESCTMPTGWIIYTDDQGVSWYAPTISSSSGATCPTAGNAVTKVAAKSKKQHKASRHNNHR